MEEPVEAMATCNKAEDYPQSPWLFLRMELDTNLMLKIRNGLARRPMFGFSCGVEKQRPPR